MIKRLLVANRGEIARRIFRTCRAMGISTAAVFSHPDRDAPFVREADEAYGLTGSASIDTYLRIDRLLEAAHLTHSDAVHPGYGFLAEDAGFAQAVMDAGLIWVGPSPKSISTMGSKLESKLLAAAAGIPTLPSILLDGKTPATVELPVLVKASAGGGGKGMRIVRDRSELESAIAGARREAAAAFGDDTVFLERYIEAPRHIEIQVFGDTRGNLVSLFERECSIQRRHQKIIEESPSTAVDEPMRTALGNAAVAIARAVDYVGAGTVEFLVDGEAFYFLEMNTRLQVEHPVTEEVTGLDLVRLQLLAASGEPLPEEALEPVIFGHSIEARLYAEDPRHDYLPAPGRLDRFRFPTLTGLRVESGVEDGSEIPLEYDPMLAKVITWAETREEAAMLLAHSLQRAEIHGTATNRDLLVRILRHPEFVSGAIDTHFLDRHSPVELSRPLPSEEEKELAAVAAAICGQEHRRLSASLHLGIPTGWRNNPSQPQKVVFATDQGELEVGYRFEPRGGVRVEVSGRALVNLRIQGLTADEVGLETEGHLRWFRDHRVGSVHHMEGPSGYTRLLERPRFQQSVREEDPGSLHAPMPGKVIRVEVTEGDPVVEGQVLLVMEAMKMEHTLKAPYQGRVGAVRASPGDQVVADQILVVVDG
jgi:acetyl/propionyl-CoA carboxylase alpha subunit